ATIGLSCPTNRIHSPCRYRRATIKGDIVDLVHLGTGALEQARGRKPGPQLPRAGLKGPWGNRREGGLVPAFPRAHAFPIARFTDPKMAHAAGREYSPSLLRGP